MKSYTIFGLVLVAAYFVCDTNGFITVASLMFLGLGIAVLCKKRQ